MDSELYNDQSVIAAIKQYAGSYFTPEQQDQLVKSYYEFMAIMDGLEGETTGQFLSAFGMKEKRAQRDGDWLSDPVNAFSPERDAFGTHNRRNSGTKLSVSLGIDVSSSMASTPRQAWKVRDKNIMDCMPKIFTASLLGRVFYRMLSNIAEQYPNELRFVAYTWAGGDYGELTAPYHGEVWLRHPDMGGSTPIDTYVKRVRESELTDGYATETKLDLVVTDGAFDWDSISLANEVQKERFLYSGGLKSVVINISPMEQVKDYYAGYEGSDNYMPDHFIGYYISDAKITAHVFQMALMENLGA